MFESGYRYNDQKIYTRKTQANCPSNRSDSKRCFSADIRAYSKLPRSSATKFRNIYNKGSDSASEIGRQDILFPAVPSVESIEEESYKKFWATESTDISFPAYVLDLSLFGNIPYIDDPQTIELIMFLLDIQRNADMYCSIVLNIHCCYGGSVDTMLFIYNVLESLNIPLYTIGNAIVYSAAADLFMLGTERYLYPNTRLLFHSSFYENLSGTDVNIYENVRSHRAIFARMYDKKLKNLLDKDRFDQMMSGMDVYLDTDEAVKLGIATGYISDFFELTQKQCECGSQDCSKTITGT